MFLDCDKLIKPRSELWKASGSQLASKGHFETRPTASVLPSLSPSANLVAIKCSVFIILSASCGQWRSHFTILAGCCRLFFLRINQKKELRSLEQLPVSSLTDRELQTRWFSCRPLCTGTTFWFNVHQDTFYISSIEKPFSLCIYTVTKF